MIFVPITSDQDVATTRTHTQNLLLTSVQPSPRTLVAEQRAHLKSTRTPISFVVFAIHVVTLRNPIHLSVRRNPLVKANTDT